MEKMKRNQQSKFVRFILRAVDVLASFYTLRPIHWEKEPLQKATEAEKRGGFFFMATLPVFMVVGVKSLESIPDSVMNSVFNARHSVIWLWLGIVLLGSLFFATLYSWSSLKL